MTNQAIIRHTSTTSLTFTSKPSEETRKALVAAGYQFNGKSGQWYRSEDTAELITEAQAAREFSTEESEEPTPTKKKSA